MSIMHHEFAACGRTRTYTIMHAVTNTAALAQVVYTDAMSGRYNNFLSRYLSVTGMYTSMLAYLLAVIINLQVRQHPRASILMLHMLFHMAVPVHHMLAYGI